MAEYASIRFRFRCATPTTVPSTIVSTASTATIGAQSATKGSKAERNTRANATTADVGTIGLSEAEAGQLRLYLQKGGFLWVDDFWGDAAWEHWSRELARALPPGEYPVEDVPLSDPIVRTMFEVREIPQVPGIGFWRRFRGSTTSERGAESAVVHLRAVRDRHGRILVLMTHNTDLSNAWERETEDPDYFYRFSVDGYAVGINVLLHALTH